MRLPTPPISHLFRRLAQGEHRLLIWIALCLITLSMSQIEARSQTQFQSPKPVLLKEFTSTQPGGLLHRFVIWGNPSELGKANRLLFAADDGRTGLEPWITDGTAQGTKLLRDIVPGSFDRLPKGSDPEFLGSTSQRVFFKTKPIQPGPFSLWSSDGTTAGTRSLTELSPSFKASLAGVPFDRPQSHAILNKQLLIAIAAPEGAQLWQSDGLTKTERLLQLKGLLPGQGIEPNFFTNAGPQTFFAAGTSNATTQLWRTDGTPKGTIALQTLNPAAQLFTPWHNRIFLEAETSKQGFEWWASDGTVKGTMLLKDIYPGPESSGPRLMTGLGKTMFALANSPQGFELWASDGTPTTTRRIKRLSNQRSNRAERSFIVHQGRLFFSFITPKPVVGGGISQDRWELWSTDGSEAGTRQITTLDNGQPQQFVSLNNHILFNANGPEGQELWRSDGTPQGTKLIADLFPGSSIIQAPCLPPHPDFPQSNCPPPLKVANSSNPRHFSVLGNHLYFIANYGSENSLSYTTIGQGQALFMTDGLKIERLQNIDQGNHPQNIVRLGDRLLFSTYEVKRDRHQLWELR